MTSPRLPGELLPKSEFEPTYSDFCSYTPVLTTLAYFKTTFLKAYLSLHPNHYNCLLLFCYGISMLRDGGLQALPIQ